MHLYVLYDPLKNRYKIGRAFSPRARRQDLGGKQLVLLCKHNNCGLHELTVLRHWVAYRRRRDGREWFSAIGRIKTWVESGCPLEPILGNDFRRTVVRGKGPKRKVTKKRRTLPRKNGLLVKALGETKNLLEWDDDPRSAADYDTMYYRVKAGNN